MVRPIGPGRGLFAAVALLAAVPLASHQPAQPRPQFRAASDLVAVDVSVLDRQRQPIRGLDVSRFAVLEDGQPRPIVAFSEVKVPGADALPAGWTRDVAPDVQTNASAGSRIFLLVFDDASLTMHPRTNQAVRQIGHAIVDQLGPDDLAAIVFTKDNRNALDFTADRTRLRALLDKFRGGGGGEMGWLFSRYSTGVMRRATTYLAEVRDRRRIIVYVSRGVGGAVGGGTDSHLRGDLLDTIREARRANIAVYPVNPAGLENLDFDAIGGAIREGISGTDAVQDAWNTINEQSDHLEVLAANTGGFVVGRSNTFASGIAQMFRESGSYYLLGFRPPRPPDGRRRRIEVRVDHPGAIVRSREGYAEPRPPRPGRAPAPVAAAMAGLLPATDLPLRVTLTPFAQPGRKDVAVLVTLGLQRPAPEAAIDELVRLLVRAFTPEGRNVRGRTLDARLALRPGAGDAKYEIHSRLDLPPGRYAVRVSAESTTLEQTGSVYADLIVPDFSKGAVSLSGVVIASEPPLRSAGGDTHDNLVPVLPTTQREFAGHAATAFIRVYQGGKAALQPITLRARIVDANGTQVFEEARTLDAVQFAPTRSADYRLELPVRDLAAGAYLLTIEATAAGQVARREVRFEAR